jgi:exonuclease SbcD
MVSALELASEETRSRQKYDEMMREIVRQLSRAFTADTINLLMMHTHLQGARFSGSEREVHLGEQWTTTPQAFPSTAHYVALGHIHKPQSVEAAPSPTRFAGSMLQLDFGEEGESKSFVVIEAHPRQPVRIETVEYEGGIPLKTVKAGLDQLETDAEELSRSGWLRVRVILPQPDPDVNGKVRRLLPNAVAVEVELPEHAAEEETQRPPKGATPGELYRAYSRHHHGDEPESNLVKAFERLYTDSGRE